MRILGPHGEALGELEPLAVGQGQLRGGRVAKAVEMGEGEALQGQLARFLHAAVRRIESAGHDVLQDRHLGERLHDLECPRDPALGDHVRLQSPKTLAIEDDLAGRHRDEPRDQVHQGGLACAIGTDQADDLALRELQADIVDGPDAVEDPGHALQFEDRLGHWAICPRNRPRILDQLVPKTPCGRK
jgi:hypothetical protein